MFRISFISLLLVSINFFYGNSQTVGTLLNTSDSYDGYTLFAPMRSNTTYLIDNCGHVINNWESDHPPGLTVYLLEDGSLLHSKNVNNQTFNVGGSGGGVERFDWNGTQTWNYDLSSSTECQHHDVEYLPNGNVLMIVWETVSYTEAVDHGRNPSNAPTDLWPDKIIEVEPNGADGGTIVWEWRAWDHLVQDFDNAKADYGIVADHPELININYPANGNSDWLHINAVDYNPELDQIALSVHNTHEIWIIDHSTTTAEAASHSGGNSGKGGDILYRWGNPQAYGRGNNATKKFFGQHDVRWITEGTDVCKIMVYNNGINRSPGVSYSTVDIIVPPVDALGNYTEPTSGESYLPNDLYWTYEANPNTDFYSSNISGAHRLPNDNTLICEGANGRLFEVNTNGETVWEYQSPIGQNGPVQQGTIPANGHSIFRCTRYGADYSAFAGKDMTPGNVLELNSSSTCELFGTVGIIDSESSSGGIQVVNNQAVRQITVFDLQGSSTIIIYDSAGRIISQVNGNTESIGINTAFWPAGVFYVSILSNNIKVLKRVVIL